MRLVLRIVCTIEHGSQLLLISHLDKAFCELVRDYVSALRVDVAKQHALHHDIHFVNKSEGTFESHSDESCFARFMRSEGLCPLQGEALRILALRVSSEA